MDDDMGPAEDTSFELAMNIATYAEDDHDMLVIDSKGYNSLAYDLLAKNFPNPLNNKNVVLKTKVDKISYTDKGVTIGATTDGKNVTYDADYVVTTFSAGVLRNKALQMFVPTLPEDKMDAIFRVDMTLFLKVFVETTENFWADVTNGAESWIFADEVKGNFTSWLDLTLPKLGANYAVPANGTYLSMCMIASDFAAQMEKLDDAQLKDEVIKAMRAMFPKAADRINTKTVTSVVMNKWGQDELFGGSWSNPARDFTKADFAKLGEPVGRVYFSGEHTSAEYFGYVHGAYRAGIETANQLMEQPEFN
jgi:polyamine oxidase